MVEPTPDATVKASEGLMMDDVPNHHPEVIGAVQAIRAAAWFLPRCSPHYNPTEDMWSKVNSHLKKFSV